VKPGDCFDLLHQHLPLGDDMTILGFEIVGAESHLDFHSWHCHRYADDVAHSLEIRTNRYGLLPTRPEARTVLDWMLSLPPAETPKPVPWTVVALAVAGMTEHVRSPIAAAEMRRRSADRRTLG
jgi:hypothetical protein